MSGLTPSASVKAKAFLDSCEKKDVPALETFFAQPTPVDVIGEIIKKIKRNGALHAVMCEAMIPITDDKYNNNVVKTRALYLESEVMKKLR